MKSTRALTLAAAVLTAGLSGCGGGGTDRRPADNGNYDTASDRYTAGVYDGAAYDAGRDAAYPDDAGNAVRNGVDSARDMLDDAGDAVRDALDGRDTASVR